MGIRMTRKNELRQFLRGIGKNGQPLNERAIKIGDTVYWSHAASITSVRHRAGIGRRLAGANTKMPRIKRETICLGCVDTISGMC